MCDIDEIHGVVIIDGRRMATITWANCEDPPENVCLVKNPQLAAFIEINHPEMLKAPVVQYHPDVQSLRQMIFMALGGPGTSNRKIGIEVHKYIYLPFSKQAMACAFSHLSNAKDVDKTIDLRTLRNAVGEDCLERHYPDTDTIKYVTRSHIKLDWAAPKLYNYKDGKAVRYYSA